MSGIVNFFSRVFNCICLNSSIPIAVPQNNQAVFRQNNRAVSQKNSVVTFDDEEVSKEARIAKDLFEAMNIASTFTAPVRNLIIEYGFVSFEETDQLQLYKYLQERVLLSKAFPSNSTYSIQISKAKNKIISCLMEDVEKNIKKQDSDLGLKARNILLGWENWDIPTFKKRISLLANLSVCHRSYVEFNSYMIKLVQSQNAALLIQFYDLTENEFSREVLYSFILKYHDDPKILEETCRSGLINDRLLVYCVNIDIWSPIMVMIPPKIVKIFFSFGLDINIKDYNGYTVLHYAVEAFFRSSLDLLTQNTGTHPYVRQWFQFQCKSFYSQKWSVEEKIDFIKWLLDNGASVNQQVFKIIEIESKNEVKPVTDDQIARLTSLLKNKM